MNVALEVAVQPHPAGALTVTFPLPPPDANEREVGEMENRQPPVLA
jgi:hypothetical protein